MNLPETRKTLPFSQLLLLLMGILTLYLLVDFARQVGVSRQRREEVKQIEYRIEAANQESVKLQAEFEYASSPEAVEGWARTNGLTRENEVLVVPVGNATDSASEEEQAPGADAASDSPREAWWDLFFGSR